MSGKHRFPKDLTGMEFGRLTVLGLDHEKSFSNDKGDNKYWRCRCVCGNEKSVARGNLTTGKIASCGCLYKDRKRPKGPAKTRHALYKVWTQMNHYHAERVHNDWRNYYAFYDWGISSGYDELRAKMEGSSQRVALQLRDPDGMYSPDNCYWAVYYGVSVIDNADAPLASRSPQYSYKGVVGTVKGWAKLLGVRRTTLLWRVREAGGDLARACAKPIGLEKKKVDLDAVVEQFKSGAISIDSMY